MSEAVNHPEHYGGENNPYEVIKVIEAWKLDFNLGNAVKYIGRLGKKAGDDLTELRKAAWYLQREIEAYEQAERAAIVKEARDVILCECGHTLGGHSPATGVCLLTKCKCLKYCHAASRHD